MFKNLSATALGITGRPNEMIELALTYGFKGFDLNVPQLVARGQGLEHVQQFLESAKMIVGGFELPTAYLDPQTSVDEKLDELAQAAGKLGATRCLTCIAPASDELPYHDNFEFHRQRLGEIGETLAKHSIQLGVGFTATPADRVDKQFQFIYEAEPLLMLIKTVGRDNVGLLLDLWHWHLGGGSTELLTGLPAGGVVALRIADLPAEFDPASIGDDQRLLPAAEGVVDMAAALTQLGELEYDGPVTIYPHPSHFDGMTRDAIVRQVSAILKENWQAAGLSNAGKLVTAAEH